MTDPTPFLLPDVGEGLEEAEIIEWLVSEGDEVTRDQPLVEILTDKSQAQIPSPFAGTVVRLGAAEGERLTVGSVLVELAGTGAPTPSAGESRPSTPAPPATAPSAPDTLFPVGEATATAPARRPKASPAVRRRAREMGIDLSTIVGSGDGGRILATDLDAPVTAATEAGAAETAAVTTQPSPPAPRSAITNPTIGSGRHPLRGIRRVTAEAMARAWAEVPHIHVHDEVDATAVIDARRRLKPEIGDHLTMLPFLCLAVVRALRRNPMLNASIDTAEGHFDVHEHIHLGVAVAAPQGLVVPVVKNADSRPLSDLATELHRLVLAARNGSIGIDDLRGATATVTNYGVQGGRFAAPIVRPPECSIVGFGSIAERPVAVDGAVVARPTIPVSIGADHRLVDGADLSVFQRDVLAALADPVLLLA